MRSTANFASDEAECYADSDKPSVWQPRPKMGNDLLLLWATKRDEHNGRPSMLHAADKLSERPRIALETNGRAFKACDLKTGVPSHQDGGRSFGSTRVTPKHEE